MAVRPANEKKGEKKPNWKGEPTAPFHTIPISSATWGRKKTTAKSFSSPKEKEGGKVPSTTSKVDSPRKEKPSATREGESRIDASDCPSRG